MGDIPGWYVDAMEQNLGMLVTTQRKAGQSVEQLAELFMDPSSSSGVLSPEEHMTTMAICLAICVRRLARVDMPA